MSRAAGLSGRQNWNRVVTELSATELRPPPLIMESWRRCRAAGLDPDAPIQLRRIPLPELLERHALNRSLILAASDLIDAFSASLRALTHVIYMTDADGIVLYSRGTDVIMQSYGLRPGFDWSEAAMGTNGAGTALACNAPVAVLGPNHWLTPFRDASCLGAPIRDSSGAAIAAVDLSTSVSDCDPRHLQGVISLAGRIGSRLRGSGAA